MLDCLIAELLPHAGDMVLLDRVLHFDQDGLDAAAVVRAHAILGEADGSLPAWVGVELMAQAIAAYAGCRARERGEPVEMGFLLGTRQYHCNVERFPLGSTLTVRARRSLEDENGMGMFECEIDGPGVEARARLSVYRPPRNADYLGNRTQSAPMHTSSDSTGPRS